MYYTRLQNSTTTTYNPPNAYSWGMHTWCIQWTHIHVHGDPVSEHVCMGPEHACMETPWASARGDPACKCAWGPGASARAWAQCMRYGDPASECAWGPCKPTRVGTPQVSRCGDLVQARVHGPSVCVYGDPASECMWRPCEPTHVGPCKQTHVGTQCVRACMCGSIRHRHGCAGIHRARTRVCGGDPAGAGMGVRGGSSGHEHRHVGIQQARRCHHLMCQ